MKQLLLLWSFLLTAVNAQLQFDPLYNLSNTPSATSDYHSVYSYNNRYYAAWGDNGQILLKTSELGQNWSANKLVTSAGSYPVITAINDNVVIAYHNLNTGVFVTKSTNNGNSWSSPFMLSTLSSGITPQISYSGTYIYAVWEERPGNNYELFFSRSTNFGDSWSPPVNISNTATTSRWVQIYGSGNTVYCTWVETTTYPFSDIYFSKSTDAGFNWTAPVNITNDTRPQNRIYMDVSIDGTIYLACDDITSYPTFNYDDIYLIKSTDGGTSWSSAVNITNNPGHSNTPCILALGNDIYFTWADNTQSAPFYDNSDIYIKYSPDGGNTWQDSVKLCSNAETSSRPRICYGYEGPIPTPWTRLTVVWYDYSTGDAEILAVNGTHFIPVELISFTASVINNNVKLNWTTASETNNFGFNIERLDVSSDQWETIFFAEGKGTTTELQEYSYTDNLLVPGKYLYRLKQIDYDGSFNYSNEIEVEITTSDKAEIFSFPNPFNSSTTIRYNITEDAFITIKVYDILGNELASLVNLDHAAGIHQFTYDGSDLASGTYFLQLRQSGTPAASMRILVIK